MCSCRAGRGRGEAALRGEGGVHNQPPSKAVPVASLCPQERRGGPMAEWLSCIEGQTGGRAGLGKGETQGVSLGREPYGLSRPSPAPGRTSRLRAPLFSLCLKSSSKGGPPSQVTALPIGKSPQTSPPRTYAVRSHLERDSTSLGPRPSTGVIPQASLLQTVTPTPLSFPPRDPQSPSLSSSDLAPVCLHLSQIGPSVPDERSLELGRGGEGNMTSCGQHSL